MKYQLLILKLFFPIFALIYSFPVRAQIADSFSLSGNINRDSGSVILYGYDRDYPELANFKPIPVIHGKFIIRERIKNPIYVFLRFDSGSQVYITERFYLEPGTQHIECHADSLREIVDPQNSAMSEFNVEYCSKEYNLIDSVSDYYKRLALRKIYLYQYSKTHPDSYVALWQISRYVSDGYNRYLDSAFSVLSAEIQNTETGKLIGEDLKQLKLTDTGKAFPELSLIDLQGKPKNISFRRGSSKYTLIDFWFAHCPACNSEFPRYIDLYNKYHEKGFSIVGISTDSTPSDIRAWKDIIKTKPLRWSQYRTSKKTIDDLRIGSFPSNFLLDSSGRIIAIDLGSIEVAALIRAKLN
jgi:thiol-disulfide isomerase/thioredoxin